MSASTNFTSPLGAGFSNLIVVDEAAADQGEALAEHNAQDDELLENGDDFEEGMGTPTAVINQHLVEADADQGQDLVAAANNQDDEALAEQTSKEAAVKSENAVAGTDATASRVQIQPTPRLLPAASAKHQ